MTRKPTLEEWCLPDWDDHPRIAKFGGRDDELYVWGDPEERAATREMNPPASRPKVVSPVLPQTRQNRAFERLKEQVAELQRHLRVLERQLPISSARYGGVRRIIPDSEAEAEIRKYVTTKKDAGLMRVDLLRMVFDLDLPSEQIERIMDELTGEVIHESSS
jgi:hypothetical protein